MNFSQRTLQKELLDGDNIPFRDIEQNMRELAFINAHLGGHRITLKGVQRFVDGHPTEPVHLVELGCGGGDNLAVIRRWAERKGKRVQLTGIDINAECIRFAEAQEANSGIRFIHSDYRAITFEAPPDVVFSSLFCHHFSSEALAQQLAWMKARAQMGFFINDLHRHPLAFHSIRLLTRLFSRSYLVKNDAPLSVRRAFVRRDWEAILAAAGIKKYELDWMWAFRWLVVCRNDHG